MNEIFGQQLTNFWPAVGLAVGFPLVLLILNESIAYYERRKHPLARTLTTFRNFVVPSLALLIFCKFVLEQPDIQKAVPASTVPAKAVQAQASPAEQDGAPSGIVPPQFDASEGSLTVRIVQTVFLIFLLYAMLGVVNDIVFGTGDSSSWRSRVPKLFRDLSRALLVAVGAMLIYSYVWGYELTNALTALGVGSVVIGLALQEPLGNIVSGLMLLFERPLNVGDWVVAEGTSGKVIEINWRSVHIETPTRELRIVPNVSLYKNSFSNLSRPTTVRTEMIEVGFSYDDSPNRVKEIMLDLLRSTPGVLADPPPAVRTVNYADFSVIYRLSFSVARQEELGSTRDTLMTRLWYVAKREGLTIPFPITMEYSPGENPGATPPTAAAWLRDHARFRPAVEGETARPPRLLDFAAGESIQKPGQLFHGFALIVQGKAALTARDADGKLVEIGEISAGECFGDQVAIGGAGDEMGIVAINDLKILVIDNQSIAELMKRSPGLAAEIGDAIETRRQAAHSARRRK